ncbi:hypothetical protein EV182_000836 [Spiromyces aspiralis]|uniref:Uncharacterized protein n=1 Tax=Spiromyces aspiralis TaxID=68401 RepID=A0ACC1HHZ3_9FUNG|nr:hypothetical protein EV182_000836 [Spiromyces aspiralis]
MSGGVDSSVAAYLLKKAGFDVSGVFMRNWDTRDERGECPSEKDFWDVQSVCRQLQIPLQEVNLVREYWNQVFSVVLNEYAEGRTPNPDLLCNQEIKFGVLLAKIFDESFGNNKEDRVWFATGHYSRLQRVGRRVLLLRGADPRKDQSYYLASVGDEQLERVIFPLGNLCKATHVRQVARDAGLTTANKDESMGVCFVGERRRFADFLAEYIPQIEGDIVTLDGQVVDAQIRYMQQPIKCNMVRNEDSALHKYRVSFERPVYGVAPGQYLVLYDEDVCLGAATISATEHNLGT